MPGPGRFLSSPRRRRRLVRLCAVAAVAAALVGLIVLYPEPEPEPETFSREPAQVIETPRDVPLTAATRKQTIAAANTFLRAAVARKDVARSWDVVDPSLREGYTRAEWRTGDIPVVPYPVESAIYRLDFAHEDVVGWKVSVYPKKGSSVRGMLFYMDVKRGPDARWRVSNWSPAASGLSPGQSAGGDTPYAIGRNVAANAEGRISPVWLLLPFALFGAVALALAGKGVYEWRRTARAVREYEQHRR